METGARSTPSEPLLKVEGLVSGYGRTTILHGIDLEVMTGEIVAIVGSNGAGKTTFVNTVSGLTRQSRGAIVFAGRRIDGMRPEAIVRQGLVQCPEGRRIFQRMSVEDNLRVACPRERSAFLERIEYVFGLFPVLAERRGELASRLSGGQQQMLAIARALMAEPLLLMLDEPSLGLAPRIVNRIMDMILRLAEGGMTILLIEQHALFALEISDYCYGFENGRIAMSGPSAKARRDPRVQRLYLAA